MAKGKSIHGDYVFSLDIGTRSIVGTVGYMEDDYFHVCAQAVEEHQTRAMIDGQIHDIAKVGETIAIVKKDLEDALKIKLKYVCIAAAGRVLKTENSFYEMNFDEDTVITSEIIYELESAGIEKAYENFQKNFDKDEKFYCVGHSVIKYYMNGLAIGNLEKHKAKNIGIDLIATFLPTDVVEGLYSAVELAGLEVINLTLEPIAAISVAIPDKFRMLNIALVDVGAGTSDICITKEGSISAYGMIPVAGDAFTEIVAQNCLVDFDMAEKIKRAASEKDEIEYNDIFDLPQSISKEEVISMLSDKIDEETTLVSDTIKKLNGDKPVSAIFVVGGGGKIEGYTSLLAEKMGIQVTRVALRGEDVMQKFIFENDDFARDSLMVTPLGICLNFYRQNNNFIFISFNDERVKLYDNGKLRIVDALMQYGINNEDLFPKRGDCLTFTLNGEEKVIKGELGEAATVIQNGETVDLYKSLHGNDIIKMNSSTKGNPGSTTLGKLKDNNNPIVINIDKKKASMPRLGMVNGNLEVDSYEIKAGDNVEILDYYTVSQIFEFMDLGDFDDFDVFVNNDKAEMDTKVYANFNMSVKPVSYVGTDDASDSFEDLPEETDENISEQIEEEISDEEKESEYNDFIELPVVVNGEVIMLKGKTNYVYVDVFDYIDFDLKTPKGSAIETLINGRNADFLEELKSGDKIDIFWKD